MLLLLKEQGVQVSDTTEVKYLFKSGNQKIKHILIHVTKIS